MPFSGSAPNQTYSRSDGVRSGAAVNVQARLADANDTAELADARENDFATAINALWKRDGGNEPTGNLTMGGNKFTGVGVAAARDEFARASQVQDSSLIYGGSAGGTANAITLDCSPSITAYAAGQMFIFKATADNTDDDVTVNINAAGDKNLRKFDGASKPAVGEVQNGGMYIILYDGTSFQLIGAVSPNELALAALAGEADRLAYFTGAGAMALATFTGAGRALLDDADAAAQRTTLGLGTAAEEDADAFEAADADILKADVSDNLTAGFTSTAFDAGTKSSGTFTPAPASGNIQRAVNGGAHTLAPPTDDCTMIIQYTNNASAGAITTSGFTLVDGAAFTTTNGHDFLAYITKVNGFSRLTVAALQ